MIRWLLFRPHSLIALGKAEGLNSVRDQIRGRVVCLESALLLLVQSVGAKSVGEALQRLRGVNTRIDVLFGYKTEFVEAGIVRQLSSYLKNLHEKLGHDYLRGGGRKVWGGRKVSGTVFNRKTHVTV